MKKENLSLQVLAKEGVELVRSMSEEGSDIVTKTTMAIKLAETGQGKVGREINKYGNVPVIYRRTKQTSKSAPLPGLLSFIESASTEKEVKNFLNKGLLDYKNASNKTIKKWNDASKKRILELNSIK